MSMFVLRTLGKNRGYTERREVNQSRSLDEMPTSKLLALYREAKDRGEVVDAECSGDDLAILRKLTG